MSIKNTNKSANAYFEIRKSKMHGKGAFATRHIPKNTKIVQYIGIKISKAEGTRRWQESVEKHLTDNEYGASYIFELNDICDIDGDVPSNMAKYFNHSCDPNCETEIKGDEIWFYSCKDIEPGEELTFNYNYDFTENIELHKCVCGSKNCIGYIISEDDKPKLLKALKHTKKY